MISSKYTHRIKAIILDVDGVMTDGMLGYGGSETIKFFNVKDGHAIKMAMRSGYKVGILSGRKDSANRSRAEELNMSFIYDGEKDKNAAFDRILIEQDLNDKECLYIGDDVVDIPVIRRAGIGVCVKDAAEEVKVYADWQTTLPGGRGAVRETIVRLLTQEKRWAKEMERYTTAIPKSSDVN